jgi:hypothetical protein
MVRGGRGRGERHWGINIFSEPLRDKVLSRKRFPDLKKILFEEDGWNEWHSFN